MPKTELGEIDSSTDVTSSSLPILDRAGQTAFWNRQAIDYDLADMTLDNEGELDIVRTLTRQFCDVGNTAEDVVTLGGAVGSRDPKVVTEVLEDHSIWPKYIRFNDLSESMTKRAATLGLSKYSQNQTEVITFSGPIHERSDVIPPMPRRVIIGVYRAEAFVTANPHYGYPLTGLEEYGKNADKIGTILSIAPVNFDSLGYEEAGDFINYSYTYSTRQKDFILQQVVGWVELGSADAIRVIGTHEGQEGFFLSHWFTEQGIRRLIDASFSPERTSTMSLMSCAKGYVVCIDSLTKPKGIVTILNNVIGNILPHEQMPTLRAIDSFTR